MKKIFIMIGFVIAVIAGPSVAANQQYTEGLDYDLLATEQAMDDPKRIEVVEFFWYGCPHCYQFEPVLNAWAKNIASDVNFYRLPAVFSPLWETHARAYFVADILNVLTDSHTGMFKALHIDRKKLNSPEQLAAFYTQYGVDEKRFEKTYQSTSVNVKVERARHVINSHGINGVPALVVAGKYLITTEKGKSFDNMLRIADYLIEKERASIKRRLTNNNSAE
ncbi:MAG: thiol:disulfide interchange protein DsbA/DsbL [Cycloclasticus sp.]|nr:thiol:disulfide interchange protein DsbA/DsbL [Cycloclasticus sp.]